MKPYYESSGVTLFHGDCIEVHFLEKCFGVQSAGIADIAAFGICYDEMTFAYIFHCAM